MQYYTIILSKALLNVLVHTKFKRLPVIDFLPCMSIITAIWEYATDSLVVLVCETGVFPYVE